MASARRGRQCERQWSILLALDANRRGLTAKQLIVHVEDATLRTVYRDLQQLQMAGFPLINHEARWQLEERPRMDCIQSADVVALAMVERSVGAGWIGQHLGQLRKQLAASLTSQGQEWVAELMKIHVTTTPLAGPLEMPGDDAIEEALEKDHVLRIHYRAPQKPAALREVQPYGTWNAGDRPYLIAWCPVAREVRTFHRGRILAAEVLDEAFERDPAFNLASYVASAFGAFAGAPLRVELEFGPEVAHLPYERQIHPTQEVVDDGGSTRVTFIASGLVEIAGWVASFGGKVRVLRPTQLIDAVRRIHEEGLRALDTRRAAQ